MIRLDNRNLDDKRTVSCVSFGLIPLNLSFFAESSGDKTEKATPRKKKKAREEGQVAKSNELNTAFLFIFVFVALRAFAPMMIERLLAVFNNSFALMSEANDYFNIQNINNYISHLFLQVLITVLPIFAVAMVVGILLNVIQVGWHPTTKPLKPKFSNISPMKGFKRIFSPKALIELVKALGKFAIIGFSIYNTLSKEVFMIYSFLDMEIFASFSYVANLAVDVGINVGAWYLAIAAADFAYTRFKHSKELRMSKQEVKDEYKSVEGNPQIKGQIRQRMREASMRRMMQDVPQADVIITNPTHYAVALQYDRFKGSAPVLVAKGVDHLALRIKDIAAKNDVTVVENKPLARTLYATVDIGKEIPPELYQSVAEILAYVYKLKNIA